MFANRRGAASSLPALLLPALWLAACSSPAPAPPDAEEAAVGSGAINAMFPASSLAQSCAGKQGWDEAAPPAHLHGRTYYVGTCGITSLLIDSGDGLILLDGGVQEAGPLVLKNIQDLGFDPKDIQYILISHEHHDHVAALRDIQAASGAPIWAFDAALPSLSSGQTSKDDPQYGQLKNFASLRAEAQLIDGQPIRLGEVEITPYATPVHAKGSASYRWRSCEKGRCLAMAYMDSLSTPPEDYRFSDHPQQINEIRQGFDKAGKISCDILITPHPSASSMMERFGGVSPLVNPQSCARYVADARQNFEQRLVKEQK